MLDECMRMNLESCVNGCLVTNRARIHAVQIPALATEPAANGHRARHECGPILSRMQNERKPNEVGLIREALTAYSFAPWS
jgi:hypothetical protein